LNGIPATPIRPSRTPHQMIARGGSLAGRVRDAPTLYGWLVRNVERLIEELHYHEVRPGVLTLCVSYLDDYPGQGVVKLDVPTGAALQGHHRHAADPRAGHGGGGQRLRG